MKKIILSLAAILIAISGRAQDYSIFDLNLTGYYRDWEIFLTADEGNGRVYIEKAYPGVFDKEVKAGIIVQTGPAEKAQLNTSYQAWSPSPNRKEGRYAFRFYAYPKPGFVSTGFMTSLNHTTGERNMMWFLKDENGKIVRSGDDVHWSKVDMQRDYTLKPEEMSSHKFSPGETGSFVAMFRLEVKQTVVVTKPGTLEESVYANGWTEADNLVVRGTLNEADLWFLHEMCLTKNLVRLDLSGARITELPDYLFADATNLYECKLPTVGLRSIGDDAFRRCHNLVSFAIPQSVTYIGKNAFQECYSWGRFSKRQVPSQRGVRKKAVLASDRKDVILLADEEATFPGGDAEMFKYLAKAIHYPLMAKEQNKQGRVTVSFIVEKDGSITGAQLLRSGICPQLDYEAIRVVKAMPKWKPAKKNGLPVATSRLLPIVFRF